MGRLPIVTYHDITNREQFARQIAHMAGRYTFVRIEQLADHLDHGTPLPDRPLLVTFDDAYPAVYHLGLDVLRKYRVPATVFVITELVGTDRPYWWDEVVYYTPDDWTAQQKKEAQWKVKEWPDAERLAYLERLRAASDKPRLRRQQLTWEQLHEMQEQGITLANHTHDHPILDQCSTEEVKRTISSAARILCEHHCGGYRYFAYPNGNLSADSREALRRVPTELAFLFDHQLTDLSADRLALSRLSMNSENSLFKTRLILSGYHSRYLNLRKKLLQ